MKILETELGVVISQIAQQSSALKKDFSDQVTAEHDRRLDAKAVRELMEKLEPLLKMGSPEALSFTGVLRLVPGSENLIEQINDFDFEAAIHTLAELKKDG
jgi:hypothetical protein